MKKFTIIVSLIFCTILVFSQENVNTPNNTSFYSILKDWQTLIAAIIVILGWFVNSKLNYRREVAKRRLDYRISAFKSILYTVISDLSDDPTHAFTQPDFIESLEEARKLLQLYGYKEEVEIYEEFIRAINNNEITETEKIKKINVCIPKLNIFLESLRNELGLESLYKIRKKRFVIF